MRGPWGLIGIVIALAIVGVLVKQRLTSLPAKPTSSASSPAVETPAQAKQVQQGVQQDVNKLMQGRAEELDKQQGDTRP